MHRKRHTNEPHDSVVPGGDAAGSSHSRGRLVLLGVLLVAQLMVILDITAVNIALPSLAADLQLSGSTVSWTITSYSLVFGSLLLFGGRLADLVGPPTLVPDRPWRLHRVVPCLGDGGDSSGSLRSTGRPGPRRRNALTSGALDHHDRLPGQPAREGACGLGRGRRCRRRARCPRRRPSHRGGRLAPDLLRQHPGRRGTRVRCTEGHPSRRCQAALAGPRPSRRASRHRQPRHSRLRDHPGRSRRLGLHPDDRAHDTRTAGTRRLRGLGAPGREAASACRAARRPRRRRRPLPDDRRSQLALRALPALLALPAERARHRPARGPASRSSRSHSRPGSAPTPPDTSSAATACACPWPRHS